MAHGDLRSISDVDISAVEPYDTPIWDELVKKLVAPEQRGEFPFSQSSSDSDDRVKGNDSDDDDDGTEDERNSSPESEDSPAPEG
jgi:hypothetical protein